MEYRELGNTGLLLSELGFGCASIWGKSFFDEEEARKLFFKACDLGINFFDTGFSYNEAEMRLGKCLQQLGDNKRNELVIATKCGTRISDSGKYYHDWSVDWLKQSVEISLERLHTDHIEMLHLHGPTIEEMTDEVLNFMYDMKSQGITKTIGINSFDTDVIKYVGRNGFFDFVMLDYNIMRQDRESLIDYLYLNGTAVIGGASLAQSLYSNRIFRVKDKKDVWYLLRALKNWRGHIREGEKFRFINRVEGMTGNQVALRYVLDNPHITSAVFGTSSMEHLVENCESTVKVLPAEISIKIKDRKKKNKDLDRK